MIVNTQDLTGPALAFMLFAVEGGGQHRGHTGMYFFKRSKVGILKGNWRPWEIKAQASDLIERHQLCVWHDQEGWHGGSYTSVTGGPVFFDAPTMSLAICLGAIGKYCGERIEIPNELLVETRRKPQLIEALLAQSNFAMRDPLETPQ